ncbi:MAG TPA: hypothetical protein VFT34_17885 [Verrucomicrobiae bacterium]|nr:hypothetical protein [Verrucomicrobiae bacterium]
MSNPNDLRRPPPDRNMPPLRWCITALISAAIAIVFVLLLNSCSEQSPTSAADSPAKQPNNVATPVTNSPFASTNGITTMEAAQSVVVVKDLGFGRQPPRLEDVVRDIERHSQPEDGHGRTFAILEAFTQPDLETSNINLCLRISTEKPGIGQITYRRTGKELWKCRITPATHKPPFTGGSLTIYFDVGDGKVFTVDGSTGPSSILTAMLKEPGVQIGPIWPEGEVRELTFTYSACGCPIKVKCRRAGEGTARTDATQVIFPDDPAAMQVINALMKW